MKYEFNHVYSFMYMSTSADSRERPFFWMKEINGEGVFKVPALDYQVSWNVIPRKLECVVTSEQPLRFAQSKLAILRDRYQEFGQRHTFRLARKGQDRKTNSLFYILEDEFHIYHRFYPGREDALLEDDQIELIVAGIEPRNIYDAFLKLNWPALEETIATATSRLSGTGAAEADIEGGEGMTQEFKTSLVYPASSVHADIDAQVKTIMQSIAGMLNSQGGHLYIGVNDDGVATGIVNDYEYLNSSRNDTNRYPLNTDGYLNKITTSIGSFLGTEAKALAVPEIRTSKSGNSYCDVIIQSSLWPVWLNGNELFVRTGVNTSRYLDDQITKFIIRRFGQNIQSLSFKPIEEEEAEKLIRMPDVESEPSSVEMVPVVEQQPSDAIRATFSLFEDETVGHFLYFLPEGQYQLLSAKEMAPANFEYRVSLPRSYNCHQGYDLVVCYDNGDTDLVNLRTALYGTGKFKERIIDGDVRNRGWNNGRSIVNAFCVKNNQKNKDLVAFVSHSEEGYYLKVHELTAFTTNGTPHQKLGNSGNAILVSGATLAYSIRIKSDKGARTVLNNLGIIRRDKDHSLGKPLKDIRNNYKDTFREILALIPDEDEQVIPVRDSGESSVAAPTQTAHGIGKEFNELFVITIDGEYRHLNGERFRTLARFLEDTPDTYARMADKLRRLYPDIKGELFLVFCKQSPYITGENKAVLFKTLLTRQFAYIKSGHDMSTRLPVTQVSLGEETGVHYTIISKVFSDGFRIVTPYGTYNREELMVRGGTVVDDQTIPPDLIKQQIIELRRTFPRMTDMEMAEEITKRGYPVARRTVTKYRKQLNLPSTR